MLGIFRKRVVFQLKQPSRDELIVFTHSIDGGHPFTKGIFGLVKAWAEAGIAPHAMAKVLYDMADNLVTGGWGEDQFGKECGRHKLGGESGE